MTYAPTCTLRYKENPLRREHLVDFVACYRADERGKRAESERFRRFTNDDLVAREKVTLDPFWLRDKSLENTVNLPDAAVIAAEIVEVSKPRLLSSARWQLRSRKWTKGSGRDGGALVNEQASARLC